MVIRFENVSKTYPGGVEAVRNLSLQVESRELTVLLGTSGCGKTTTLKMINRLIEPTSGRILVDGDEVTECDPVELRRRIGYAIQHIGLFPHMTVGENIAVVPKLLKWASERISSRIDTLLKMVGLDPDQFRDRFPAQLSGGQQQRVGVARSLAADPDIVLMDEPFGALDPITREQLQGEFLKLQQQLRKTIVFVTHDVFEAVKLADRVALLDGGQLQQLGRPAEIVENPANRFVDRFLGEHRFQLTLLTRQVLSLSRQAEEPGDVPKESKVEARSSLVEALDAFKKTGRRLLHVYSDDGPYQGRLHREDVVEAVAEAVGQKAKEHNG